MLEFRQELLALFPPQRIFTSCATPFYALAAQDILDSLTGVDARISAGKLKISTSREELELLRTAIQRLRQERD